MLSDFLEPEEELESEDFDEDDDEEEEEPPSELEFELLLESDDEVEDRYCTEMLLSFACAAFRPSHADSLNDLSLIPPVSVTTQALNAGAAEAGPELEAKLTVNMPRTNVVAPSKLTRRRILPMKISLYSFSNP